MTQEKQSTTTTLTVATYTDEAIAALSRRWGEPDWMRELRLESWRIFQETPRPTLQDEPWRRTDIRHLDLAAIAPTEAGGSLDDLPSDWAALMEDPDVGGTLLHVNAVTVHQALADELAAQGVIFAPMGQAVREHPDLLRRTFMTQAVVPTDGYFAALHGALWRGGTFLYVPRNVEVPLPLRAVTWATSGQSTFTHTLVVVEPGGRVTFVDEYGSQTEEGMTMHNGVVELILHDGAQLDYVNLQDWGRHVYQFTHERALVGRDATLHWVLGGMGSKLTKSFLDATLAGPGATALMSGVYFADDRQHLDFDTQQNHLAPNTTSDLLYKGALRDQARTVWQGMIKVFPGAQKTDGYQANRNLVLNRGARADSIPGLEIEADDVRCTHGSTAGPIDPEQLFYLMSRGLREMEAKQIIVEGFFTPVLERIPLESVRRQLEEAIRAKSVRSP